MCHMCSISRNKNFHKDDAFERLALIDNAVKIVK